MLAKASYGSVEITQDYASTVTIKSATPLAAKFNTISIFGASNVRIDGVHVDNGGNGAIAIEAGMDTTAASTSSSSTPK